MTGAGSVMSMVTTARARSDRAGRGMKPPYLALSLLMVVACHDGAASSARAPGEGASPESSPDTTTETGTQRAGADPLSPEGDGADSPSPSSSSSDPLAPRSLEGPFARVEDYLEAHPLAVEESCEARPRPKAFTQRIGASGPFREGRLLRIAGTLACASVEYCVTALHTAEGWFAMTSAEPCQGVIGPRTERVVQAPKTHWAGAGGEVLLAIEETRQTRTTEVEEVNGVRDEREQQREARYVTLCGVGPSKRPSCTTPIVLSCPNAQGTNSEATWSWAEGHITFESAANPQDACEWDAPFLVGDFEVRFP